MSARGDAEIIPCLIKVPASNDPLILGALLHKGVHGGTGSFIAVLIVQILGPFPGITRHTQKMKAVGIIIVEIYGSS